MKEILKVIHLKKSYETGEQTTMAVRDISFTVGEGELIAIMGASGSGKTTLLNCISTIDTPSCGQIVIAGKEVQQLTENEMAKFRRQKLGFIFQDFNLLDTLTVEENISLSLTINHISSNVIREKVKEVAEKLGISAILKKYPYEISGGEKQRCACARAIINEPALVLADEPTGSLDSVASKALMETIQFMNRKIGSTILLVTHDIFVAAYAKRILFLKDGMLNREIYIEEMDMEEKLRSIMGCIAQQEEI